MKTAAVILAAGSSSRFGSEQPKQDLVLHGETLVQRCCRVALEAGASPIILILGSNITIKESLPPEIITITNPHSEDGMGSSLALAAVKLLETEAVASLVLLPDQPAIEANHLQALVAQIDPVGTTICLAKHDEITGPPACFHRSHFKALSQLTGDQGGKIVALQNPSKTTTVDLPEAQWDIDTQDAWEDYLEQLRQP